jgi:predicted dienelactone hydrolase
MVQFEISAATQSRGDASGAMNVTVWYPAPDGTAVTPFPIGPSDAPLFDGGSVAFGAPIAAGAHPLIVLSHGTGGSAVTLSWLAEALASHGYIVAGPDHPGNNALHPYTAQGFSLAWLRARDLSAVVDALLASPRFAPSIDRSRIGAAGFSLGGYTVIEIAGARSHVTGSIQAPPEFPDLTARVAALQKSDPAYAAAFETQGASYRDPRVKSVFALAPAIGQAVTRESLAAIEIPVSIVVGSADTIAPPDDNARYYAGAIPGAALQVIPDAGHYTFLDVCLPAGVRARPELCTDREGLDRGMVHAKAAASALAFFAHTLAM